jgi:hypothetical protein
VAAFERAFRTLKREHREVLVLVAVHGLPYEQAAAIGGCKVGTVKSRVNRARTDLKRMAHRAGDGPAAGASRGRQPASITAGSPSGGGSSEANIQTASAAITRAATSAAATCLSFTRISQGCLPAAVVATAPFGYGEATGSTVHWR